MKIEVALTLKDEDGNTVRTERGVLVGTEQLTTVKIIQLIRQHVGESICSLLTPTSK